MRRAIPVALLAGAVVASAAAIGIGAAVMAAPQTMGQHEYEAAMRGIETARDGIFNRCEALLSEFERDFCRTEAAANEMVRVADIEDSYRGTQQSSNAAGRARVEARYQVDRAKCGALGGFKHDKCLISAHAARGRSMIEAAASHEVSF